MEIATTPSPSNTPGAATPARPVISSDFETFLKMLSTQLQNQDPLNPVDSADYAVQLATFSSVEQQVLTNNLLEDLVGRVQLSGMTDLAGWVGMEALSPSGTAAFDGSPVTLALAPPSVADRAVLVVRDAFGTVVHREDLPLAPGPYEWAGQTLTGGAAAHGSYTFELEASSNGELLSIDPVASYARVVEARRSGEDTLLVLNGGGTISSDQVLGLRQ